MHKKLSNTIAKNIRKNRLRENFTLKNLSKISKVSISMISKIENYQTLPSIETYLKISSALGISFNELLVDDSGDIKLSLVKENEQSIISKRFYSASPLAYKKRNKGMEPFIFYYPKGKKIPKYSHENEEMIYLLQGSLEFTYGEKSIILNEGDCVYFEGTIEHGARAISENGAKAIVVELLQKK